jgi:hypothetical protein
MEGSFMDASVVSQKFVEQVSSLSCHTGPSLRLRINSSRYPERAYAIRPYGIPGFRVALAIATLPGMTFETQIGSPTSTKLQTPAFYGDWLFSASK